MPKVTISKEVSNHANDPYFVKKAEAAKAFIDKHGLPKELAPKQ